MIIGIRKSIAVSTIMTAMIDCIASNSRNKKELNVVCDQFGSPTHARDLAKAIIKIIRII